MSETSQGSSHEEPSYEAMMAKYAGLGKVAALAASVEDSKRMQALLEDQLYGRLEAGEGEFLAPTGYKHMISVRGPARITSGEYQDEETVHGRWRGIFNPVPRMISRGETEVFLADGLAVENCRLYAYDVSAKIGMYIDNQFTEITLVQADKPETAKVTPPAYGLMNVLSDNRLTQIV